MASGQRRLAAIMFTDMVGYSALAQADEGAALDLLERHHRLLRPLFERFRGREVKTVGDAFLVEFESALDATNCAVEIQRALHEHNRSAPEGSRIMLRIGVHVGDVVRSDGDVLGDAVNIASRIHALAEPGGICLTQQVVDQVQNKVDVRLVQLPPPSLKNIRAPVAVHRVVLPWAASDRGAPRAGAGLGRHLAVLPLANISPDPADAYFADGLTEELITTLSQVRELSVIARTSVMSYKDTPKPVAQIGRDLNVDSVLEGSVRKAGNRIRISLQLVDVATQQHIWANSYNREIDDVFAVQADIAERTAEVLKLELGKEAPGPGERRPGPDPAAYDAYLRGLVASTAARDSEAAVAEAIRCFERATELDPTFAEAFAEWAEMYVVAAGDTLPMAEVMPQAHRLAARALELDPNSSEGHSALANATFQFDQDWATAEKEFRRAIELNPSNATAHQFFGLMLIALDRLDEARDEIRRVLRLDPGGGARYTLLRIDTLDGRFDEAVAAAKQARDEDPSAAEGHVYLGITYLNAGRIEDARREATASIQGANDAVRFDHGLLSALVGHVDVARATLAAAEAGTLKTYISGTHLAMLYSALGERAKALDLLERAYREGDRVLWLWYRDVWFDPIREDPRFVALLRQYGVPTGRVRGPARRRSDLPKPR
jgi:adenylate cyclase